MAGLGCRGKMLLEGPGWVGRSPHMGFNLGEKWRGQLGIDIQGKVKRCILWFTLRERRRSHLESTSRGKWKDASWDSPSRKKEKTTWEWASRGKWRDASWDSPSRKKKSPGSRPPGESEGGVEVDYKMLRPLTWVSEAKEEEEATHKVSQRESESLSNKRGKKNCMLKNKIWHPH